jgi:hypothetical protein
MAAMALKRQRLFFPLIPASSQPLQLQLYFGRLERGSFAASLVLLFSTLFRLCSNLLIIIITNK